MPVVFKHLWIIVKSTGGKNNGHNLLRFSMVVDDIKESRTRMGSTRYFFTIVSKGVCLRVVRDCRFQQLKMVQCNNHK